MLVSLVSFGQSAGMDRAVFLFDDTGAYRRYKFSSGSFARGRIGRRSCVYMRVKIHLGVAVLGVVCGVDIFESASDAVALYFRHRLIKCIVLAQYHISQRGKSQFI